MYNFRLASAKEEYINDLLWKVYYDHQCPFKVNLSFSFILRHKLSGDLRFWDLGETKGIFNKPKLIRNLGSFKSFVEEFTTLDYIKKLFEQRPNTKWLFDRLLSMCVVTYKIYEGKCFLKED